MGWEQKKLIFNSNPHQSVYMCRFSLRSFSVCILQEAVSEQKTLPPCEASSEEEILGVGQDHALSEGSDSRAALEEEERMRKTRGKKKENQGRDYRAVLEENVLSEDSNCRAALEGERAGKRKEKERVGVVSSRGRLSSSDSNNR